MLMSETCGFTYEMPCVYHTEKVGSQSSWCVFNLFARTTTNSGHYVPQLAMLLTTAPVTGFSLKGFIVGNPSFDHVADAENYWGFMCSHGFCSGASYAQVRAAGRSLIAAVWSTWVARCMHTAL